MQIGQVSIGGDYNYIKNDGVDILAYDLGDVCNTYYPRNDGVSVIAKAVNSGQNIDGMMMQFGLTLLKTCCYLYRVTVLTVVKTFQVQHVPHVQSTQWLQMLKIKHKKNHKL